MALVIANRVREASATIGTGAMSLLGAALGYQSFAAAVGTGNTTYYAIVSGAGQWEIGLGTVVGTELQRTTVLDSSSGGSLVNFAPGTKDVFATLPAGIPALVEDLAATGAGKGAEMVAADDGAGGALWGTVAGFIARLRSGFGASVVGFRQSGTGAIDRTIDQESRELVKVTQFSSIQAALTYAAANGKTVVFPAGNYSAASLSCACPIVMDPGAKLIYNGAQNGTLIEVTGSGLDFGRLHLDANNQDATLLKVTGSNNSFESVTVRNVTASATSTTAIYGVQDTGTGNRFGDVRVVNFANTGQANGSFPQAFYSASGSTIQRIEADVCAAVLVTGSASGVTRVGELLVKSATDNGVYQLGGHVEIGRLSYHGSEEPAVFSGSAEVGQIDVYGPALMVGFQNCGNANIGRLNLNKSADGSPGSAFRVRTGSTACGRITIGEIAGTFRGSTLWYLADGTVEYLSIGKSEIVFEYDAAVCTSPSSWANLTACKGYKLDGIKVEIIDVNGVATGSTIFQMTAPTAPVKRSYVNYLDVINYAADGQSASAATFRGINFAKAITETSGVSWRTDIGPYIIGSIGNVDDTTNAIPAAGEWVRGKRLRHSAPSAAGIEGWVCVLGGTPGTWKTFGSIAA